MARARIRERIATVASGTPASAIIRILRQRGAMTAAQIARHSGLARSTISTAVSELKDSRIVIEMEQEPGTGSAGRPGILLSLNPVAGTCIGIHLANDYVQIVAADVSHNFLAEELIPLGTDYAPGDTVGPLQSAYRRFFSLNGLSQASLMGVGVSVSGPVRHDGLLSRGGILPRWTGMNIREFFAPLFPAPVQTDNESNCAALAEFKWGAARGHNDFVLFKMDIGVGGAIFCNGKLVRGISGGAGEFGHVSINPEGDLCRCGNRGCLELYASFVAPLEQLSKVHRKTVAMEEAIAMAEAGDAGALRLIADAGDHGGRGLAMIGTVLNPPLILVGGRMAMAGDLILAPMKAAFQRHTLIKPMGTAPATDIRIGKFTENDSLLGAVGLVLDHAMDDAA